MSKSGLFAHFGSKEELQLATVETASELFDEIVIDPALAAPTGIERLRAAVRELPATRRGQTSTRAAASSRRPPPSWTRALVRCATARSRSSATGSGSQQQAVRDAQAEGAIDPSEDPDQLAFELEAYLMLANQMFVIGQRSGADRAGAARDRAAARGGARGADARPRA